MFRRWHVAAHIHGRVIRGGIEHSALVFPVVCRVRLQRRPGRSGRFPTAGEQPGNAGRAPAGLSRQRRARRPRRPDKTSNQMCIPVESHRNPVASRDKKRRPILQSQVTRTLG